VGPTARISRGLGPLVPAPPITTPTRSVLSPVPAPVRTERLMRWPGAATTTETVTTATDEVAVTSVVLVVLVTRTEYEPESAIWALLRV
jgi:hypothetical protein